MAKKQKKQRPKITLPRVAPFDFEISYKNYEELTKLVNDRGRIIGSKRTGLSAKHQKLVSREIKRARHLALLPFKGNI